MIPICLYYYYQRDNSLIKTAKLSDRLKAASFYFEKTLQSETHDVIYLDQAIKRCLSTRYYAAHIHPDRKIARTCSALLKLCRGRLKETTIYSQNVKFRYSAFIRFPGLYWLYRSITEPDMWRWEIVERKKCRAAKKEEKQL